MSQTERDISFFVARMDSREDGRPLCNDLTQSGRGTSPGGKRRLIRGGGQPPGSVMEFDPRTPVVVRCSSRPSGMWPWRGRCFN